MEDKVLKVAHQIAKLIPFDMGPNSNCITCGNRHCVCPTRKRDGSIQYPHRDIGIAEVLLALDTVEPGVYAIDALGFFMRDLDRKDDWIVTEYSWNMLADLLQHQYDETLDFLIQAYGV